MTMQLLRQAPQNRSQLDALVARRSEMQSQLNALTERRGDLAQQRLNAIARVDAGATADQKLVTEYTSRIDEMGARIRSLEADVEKANEQILTGMQNVGDERAIAAPTMPAPPGIPEIPVFNFGFNRQALESRYQMLMMGEALLFILLGIVGWRVLTRRIRRNEVNAGSAPVGELRTAVDTIAVEVERISENQRYLTKLLTEREEARLPPRAGLGSPPDR